MVMILRRSIFSKFIIVITDIQNRYNAFSN